jgi:hypothetical protein
MSPRQNHNAFVIVAIVIAAPAARPVPMAVPTVAFGVIVCEAVVVTRPVQAIRNASGAMTAFAGIGV